MANIRVKDLPNADTLADADEMIIDSSGSGTRRIAYSELKSEVAADYVAAPSTYKLATLGNDNRLTTDQIPDTLSQGLNFVGVANSAGDLTSTTQGDFYVIQTAFGVYSVGDQAVYDGSAYVKVTSGTKQISEGGTGATTLSGAQTELKIPSIGSEPNQSPLNLHLGSMAYKDFDAFYETGTFTPTIYYQNPTGLSTSYTTQSGNYVRLGDLICIQIKLTWTVTGTPINDNIGVGGIPFQPARVDSMMCHDSAGQSSFVITNAGNDILVCQSSSLASNLADNVGAGTHTIYISGTYQIA